MGSNEGDPQAPRAPGTLARRGRWSARLSTDTDPRRGLWIAEVAATVSTTYLEVLSWAVWELERRRPEAVDGCCFTVEVDGPGLFATGRLFAR